jgi:EpsI family protein
MRSITLRLAVLALCFGGTAVYAQRATRPEVVPLRRPLVEMPYLLDSWQGRDLPRMSADVLAVLGADDYLNRMYVRESRDVVSLYIGFYQSQRNGDTIHSPMNCLPGAGWQPMTTSAVDVPLADGSGAIHAKRVLIQKGPDQQVVLYWYQSHGRSIANEYVSKAYMIYDAFRLNRSDAALVRVVSPVLANDTEEAAGRRAVDFITAFAPRIERFLPS